MALMESHGVVQIFDSTKKDTLTFFGCNFLEVT